ncbi:MAG TPA: hypothetical protein VK181_24000, partial [Rhizobium sp.]|nr:hypothetical protein [Rhizobium sp.]
MHADPATSGLLHFFPACPSPGEAGELYIQKVNGSFALSFEPGLILAGGWGKVLATGFVPSCCGGRDALDAEERKMRAMVL